MGSTTSGDGAPTERVAERLREAIREGRLKPGARVRQEEVAREFGTSRQPVRQALHTLAGEGLIVVEPYVGARVMPLTLDELVEVYLMRERLEPLALSLNVPRLSEEQLGTLRRLSQEMEELAQRGNPERWLEIDTRFHLESFRGLPFPRLLRTIDSLWDRAKQYRRVYLLFPQSIEISHLEHRLLLDALERRAAQDAEQLLEVHIRRTRLGLSTHAEILDEVSGSRRTRTGQSGQGGEIAHGKEEQ